MWWRIASLAAFAVTTQARCPDTPTYSPCEMVFELNDAEAAEHTNPYLSVELHAEFRSPEAKTFLMNGFWDGGRRMLVRFSPVLAGRWDFRITSNIGRFNGEVGSFNATESDSKGFVIVNNLRHFSYTEKGVKPYPHLWMGDTCYRFAVIDRELFEKMVDARVAQKFNHLRGLVMGNFPGLDHIFRDADTPNTEYFRTLDERVGYLHRRGVTADLIFAGDENHLVEVFPTWQQRARYIRYVVSRYGAFNVTWQGVQEFEEYEEARALLKEIGEAIRKSDPYDHPRSTHTTATSAPLLPDGWMDYIAYQSSDIALGAIEHQLYAVPQVNTEFGYENSGAGASHPHHVDADTFRRRLWNASMNGQYPTYGNTGTYGGRGFEPAAQYLDSPGARQMAHWFDFFSNTRHWELEPYFDVDGGRALALPGVEYIVYIETPGPVDIVIEKKTYQVYWFNPATGESVQMKKAKEFKGERFTGQPPTTDHDWVLHLSRDDRKRSMANSFYFESRRVPIQEVELDPKRRPYEIVAPPGGEVPVGKPVPYGAKVTRATRASSRMLFLWTADVAGGGQGYRVVATGATGELTIPESIVVRMPANVNLRLLGMNLLGKVYAENRVYKLTQ